MVARFDYVVALLAGAVLIIIVALSAVVFSALRAPTPPTRDASRDKICTIRNHTCRSQNWVLLFKV